MSQRRKAPERPTLISLPASARSPTVAWHRAEPADMPRAVAAVVEHVHRALSTRHERIIQACALYGSLPDMLVARDLAWDERMGINRIAEAVDTLVAEVSVHPPRPIVVPRDADWHTWQRSRLLSQWLAALFDADARDVLSAALRDAVITGLGAVRAVMRGRAPAFERIHPLQILVDDRLCVDVPPRWAFVRSWLERSYAAELYPDHRDAIERAHGSPAGAGMMPAADLDLVELLEGWHLPSTAQADDGRHVLVCGDGLLLDEPWAHETFAFAVVRALQPQRGWWPDSPTSRVAPAQAECNRILMRIQDSMSLHAIPRIFVEPGSIGKTHIDNEIGSIIECRRTPTFLAPHAMSPDTYQHLDRVASWIHQGYGVSEMAAHAQKPPGITAAVALRAMNAIQARRWATIMRAYERLYCDAAVLAMRVMDAQPDGSPVVRMRSGYATRAWADMRLDIDHIAVEVQPVSALSSDAPGRLQELSELLERGVIDQATMVQMLDAPDLEAVHARITAPRDLIQSRIEQMLDSGEYWPPEPTMALDMATAIAAVELQRAELHGAPEERLDLLRRWLGDIAALQARMAAPPPPPPPEALPGALPVPPGPPPGLPPELAAAPGPSPPSLAGPMIGPSVAA